MTKVRGRPYFEWIPTIDEMRRDGRHDDALALLGECITAAERDARTNHGIIAPAYTLRAAMIHRKLVDPAAEIAVLERYVKASPSGMSNDRVVDRLVSARAIAVRKAAKNPRT